MIDVYTASRAGGYSCGDGQTGGCRGGEKRAGKNSGKQETEKILKTV